jgi:tetratricopeptide (TPR) repeat protein
MRGAAAVAVMIGVLLAGPARAEDARSRALAHFEAGRKLYQVGDYAPALVEFKRAFLLKEDPVFIFNIAQCHRRLGDTEQAITFYRRYLGTNPPAANRQQVEKLIADLERQRPAVPASPPPAPPEVARAPVLTPSTPAPAAAVFAQPPAAAREEPAIYTRWWFWTGLVAVAGGAAAAVILTRHPASPGCSAGVDYCATLPR